MVPKESMHCTNVTSTVARPSRRCESACLLRMPAVVPNGGTIISQLSFQTQRLRQPGLLGLLRR